MPLSPTLKKNARTSIVAYCAAARRNEPNVHYDQFRPFRFYDKIGAGKVVLDCSGFVVNCFWNAGHDLATYIADPSGYRYSGWGNTWTMVSWLQSHGRKLSTQPYLPGDVAMYDGHTAICHKSGNKDTARWTSHGTESGPVEVKLHYRGDLVGVYRHPALL